MDTKRTPLYEKCLKSGGRMTSFAGWEMPIHFSSLLLEHQSVRNEAGLFDISHMGVFLMEGNNLKDELQKLIPTDLYQIGAGEACYTVLLNKNGGIVDDLIVYDLGINAAKNESLMLVINAACTVSDINWIKTNLNTDKIKISDAKKDGVLLALQGPKSKQYLDDALGMSIENDLSKLPRFGHITCQYQLKNSKDRSSIFISRTGYTGEEGFEILLGSQEGQNLWDILIEKGVTPCGLGARDTLRLEAAMHLYGNDINEGTTPFEAGLGWLVHLEMQKSFIGREALEEQSTSPIPRRLVGLEIQGRGIARKGYQIIFENKCIGEVTSGSWSPTLEKAIALAYVPNEFSKIGTNLHVQIRGKLHQAMVVKKPFYRRIS